jgi:hypothetical protein
MNKKTPKKKQPLIEAKRTSYDFTFRDGIRRSYYSGVDRRVPGGKPIGFWASDRNAAIKRIRGAKPGSLDGKLVN